VSTGEELRCFDWCEDTLYFINDLSPFCRRGKHVLSSAASSLEKKKETKTEIIYLFVFHAANPGAMVCRDVSGG
jgi:hypothetical protein